MSYALFTQLQLTSGNSIAVYNTSNSNYVGFTAPTATTDNLFILPGADGTTGQALVTDGSNGLYFATILTNAGVSINTDNFVTYVSATSDLNLGAKQLTAAGMTGTSLSLSAYIVAPGISTLHSKSIVIDVPSETADYPIWKTPYAITIQRVAILCTGAAAANIVGFLDEADANGAGASIVSADATAVSGTDLVTTTFTNAGIDANDYIRWHTTSTSGVLESACISMDYTVN